MAIQGGGRAGRRGASGSDRAGQTDGEVQRLALDNLSGAELLLLIEDLRDQLYCQIGGGSDNDDLACALEISRHLDEAIVRLMRLGSDRVEST